MKSKIVETNITLSKEEIRDEIQKDKLIVFLARVLEDLEKCKKPSFYGRLKEIFLLIYPYSYEKDWGRIKTLLSNIPKSNNEGLKMSLEEALCIRKIVSAVDSRFRLVASDELKNFLRSELKILVEKYLPESSVLLPPEILARLIGGMEGIKKVSMKPASTIQLIGAEKALFRHKSRKCASPKHGLIYSAPQVKIALNKGKAARNLAGKLAITLRVDYFRRFSQ